MTWGIMATKMTCANSSGHDHGLYIIIRSIPAIDTFRRTEPLTFCHWLLILPIR